MPLDSLENKALEKNCCLSAIILNFLFLGIFIGILLVTFHDHSWMQKAFTYSTYYIIFALTVIWLISLINLCRNRQFNLLVFVRQHWKGLLASFLLASIIFISVPKYFRVLSDETNLLSVSKSMTYYKNVENITEGRWYYEVFWPTPTTGIEKRPFLFPFFTSLLHVFLGYRVENVFILNFFAFWVMLFLLYIATFYSLGALGAISALILVGAQPIIALSATSGSFEIFNFLFIIASFLALKGFLNDPKHNTFIVLVLTLVMLANIRYESVIFFIMTMVVLLSTGYIKPRFFSQSFLYGLSFLFFLPLIWQRVLLISGSDPNLVDGSWIKAFRFENFL